MTTFVLVHGAWHQGWVWERVEPLLRENGHHVVAPSLQHAPGTRLRDHVDQLVDVVISASGPVSLVAHSYGGLPASEVVATMPDHISNFILVEGWLANPGQSMLDVTPDWFSDWCRGATTGQPSALPAPPLWTFGVEPDSDVGAWLAHRLVQHPMSTFTDQVTVGLDDVANPAAGQRVALDAVTCTPAVMPFRELAAAHGFRTHEIEAGHDVMLTHPCDLAQVLMSIVEER